MGGWMDEWMRERQWSPSLRKAEAVNKKYAGGNSKVG